MPPNPSLRFTTAPTRGFFVVSGIRTPVPLKKPLVGPLEHLFCLWYIFCMTFELVLAILIFTNTIVIIATLSVIIFVLIRMGMETAKFTDIENSFIELTKIIDQQSRLLEFISRRS